MENSIPALIIGAILIVAASLTARSSLQSFDQLGQSLRAMDARAGEQSQTRLSITGATLNAGANHLTVTLRNDGQTRFAAFDRFDLIVTYFTNAGTKMTVWLPYSNTAASNNDWTVMSVSGGAFEPGILNPGETAQIEVHFVPPIKQQQTNYISISVDNGATVSAPFSS